MSPSDFDIFWKFVKKGEEKECWVWSGFKRPTGYGTNYGMSEPRAHRMSWALHNGPIPEGLCVCHRCDNPPCCNPAHLFLGTVGDNMRDRTQKGRQFIRCGELAAKAKLTAVDVLAIRLRSGRGDSNRAIAQDYPSVQTKTIRRIVKRETWNHIK